MKDKQAETTAVKNQTTENNQASSTENNPDSKFQEYRHSERLTAFFAKPTEDTETPEEKAGYSEAWEDALIDSDFQDKIKLTKERIERLNKLTCETPKEELDRQKAKQNLERELAELQSENEPKRQNQKDKVKVRKIAKELWKENPTRTIPDVTNDKKIKSATSRHYKPTTIRNWIKDLAPNRSPGRRKRQTS